MPTLTLIDGSGFIFRAYHTLPPMTDPEGTPVNAVYGFTNMILKLKESSKADYIAVVFDVARVTFRNRLYADYKAHRPAPPEDLRPQFALVRDAARALGLPVLELADYEADDLIATYTCRAREAGWEVKIVSSDKDLMQCITDGVRMFDPLKNKIIGPEAVMEKFGVGPDKVIDVLALIGDSSDNVPGVPSIGPKTAAELINHYGNLEELLAHAGEIKQPKRRDVLMQNAEQARLSYKLISLDCSIPLPIPLNDLAVRPPDGKELQAFLQKHGFRSLLVKLKDKFKFEDSAFSIQHSEQKNVVTTAPVITETKYHLVQDAGTLSAWIAKATSAGQVAFDCETTGLDPLKAELVGFSLSITPGEAIYVPLAHRTAGGSNQVAGDLFTSSNNSQPTTDNASIKQIPLSNALALLKPLLENASVLKIGQNIKYDMLVMHCLGIDIHPIDDAMLMSYCMNAGLHAQNMDELAERYLGIKTITFDEVTGTGRGRISFAEVELEKACAYAAEDADITLRLAQEFKEQLFQKQLLTLYETIERPLVPVIADMEIRGIKVDSLVLAHLSKEFEAKMHRLEAEIYTLAGKRFNIGSPKQLGEILFDELSLPGGKKSTKTGAYATDVQVLEELAEQGYELPSKVIEWRQVAKLKSTYTDTLPLQIHPKSHRVHTSFAMAIAATGRLSSSDPNLQNIPIRTAEGKTIRTAFVAAEGYKLISADYSQIELRLLAHIADIVPLKEAFRHGKDIHAATAAQMFGVTLDGVTPELRRRAKTINFGIIYGISAHGLAVRLGIPRGEAARYIEQYFQQYPGIKDYMERTKLEAREKGYVTSLFGRRCHVPGINDKNGARRQYAERAAINAPLQGTAADIIKRAMIAVDRALKNSELDCHMLLQVHDELIFEVKEGQEEQALAIIKPAMEHAANLSIPLVVEAACGNNWGEVH